MPKADETPRARANRQATRAIVAVFLFVATVFIIDSTWELAKGAFELDRAEAPGTSPEALACYAELTRLEGVLDRAVAESAKVTPELAAAAYETSLAGAFSESTMQSAEGMCRKVPRGMAAFSSFLRVRRAEEAALAERAAELGPLRGDLHRALPH